MNLNTYGIEIHVELLKKFNGDKNKRYQCGFYVNKFISIFILYNSYKIIDEI